MTRLAQWLSHRGFWLVLSILGVGIVAVLEQDVATLPFLACVFAAIFLAALLVTRRVVFAVAVSWSVIAILTAISLAKRQFTGMVLHAFDAYFYQRNFAVVGFLLESFALPIILCVLLLLIAVAACIVIYRAAPRTGLRRAQIGAMLLAVPPAIYLSYPAEAHQESFYSRFHIASSFFASLKDTRTLFSTPEFQKRLSELTLTDTFSGHPACDSNTPRSDVIVVLMESAMPPGTYPELKAPDSLQEAFAGSDGRVRPLRVETFGGGTWISTAAMLTGIPTTAFGWLRPYLTLFLHGRSHHSLATMLKACGYKTAAISPMPYLFVNEGPFMSSIGIDDFLDGSAIGAASKHERDDVYFNAAYDYVAKHRKTDGRPLFLFVTTMAPHSPFDYRLDPDTKVEGESFGNGAEMDEYLRRLILQRQDFRRFTERVADGGRGRPTIVAEFGDHQPVITRELAERDNADAIAQWDSKAYLTYYNITPINTTLRKPLPDFPALDLPFLAATMLDVAGLPRDDVFDALLALRDRCDGAFALCPDTGRVERHLKALSNAGFLQFDAPEKEL